MAHGELSLDLKRFGTDSAAQHKALIDFLKARKYHANIYYYGPTNASIVDWLKGEGEKPAFGGYAAGSVQAPKQAPEGATESPGEAAKEPKGLDNSVRLFTIQDLYNIERSIASGKFEGELIGSAVTHPNPAIAIYKARHLVNLPEEEGTILPGHEFEFKDFEKRYEALRAIVRLL